MLNDDAEIDIRFDSDYQFNSTVCKYSAAAILSKTATVFSLHHIFV
jgi:hypothetical protein